MQQRGRLQSRPGGLIRPAHPAPPALAAPPAPRGTPRCPRRTRAAGGARVTVNEGKRTPIGPVPPRGSRRSVVRSQLGSGGSSPPTKRLTNPLRPCASWVAVSAGESRGRGCGSQGAAAPPHRAHSSRWFWSKEAPPGANCSRARSARRVLMDSRRETAAAHRPGRDPQRVLPTAPPSQREAEISHRLRRHGRLR